MCRAGGRRCPGSSGRSCTRANAAARARLYRGRKALDAARSAGDRQAADRAMQRIHEARLAQHPDLAGDTPATPEQSAAERRAVSDHAGGTFMTNNAYIANGYRVPSYAADDREFVAHMADTVANVERAVNRHRLAEPVTVSRALPAMWADQAYGPVGSGVGEVFTERRLTSTTFDTEPDHTKHGGRDGVTVVYELAAGARALDVNAFGIPADRSERELLLGSHQSFRKASDEVVDGRRVIRMVMPEESRPEPESPTERESTGVPDMKLGPAPTEDERAKLEAFVANMQARADASPDDRFTAGAKRDAEARAEISRRARTPSRLQPPASGGLEANIRDAYEELSTKTQDWVRLSALREKLGNPDKAEMDRILLTMMRTGRVHLAPSSDRKALTDGDHAAAYRVGREDKHLIAIEPPDDDSHRGR